MINHCLQKHILVSCGGDNNSYFRGEIKEIKNNYINSSLQSNNKLNSNK